MRIIDLRKKIIVNFSASGALLLIVGVIFGFYLKEKSGVESKIEKIKSETSALKNQASEFESKTTEVKKYRELWENLTPNKKITSGIKMDDVNTKLATIADKYTISDPAIKVTMPEVLKDGIFKRDTVSVLFTTVNLTFSAVNDVKALLFISEFLESLQGYPVVTNLEIRKAKNYTSQDFVSISSGKFSGAISGKVDFSWYAYKDDEKKSDEVKPTAATNPEATKQ